MKQSICTCWCIMSPFSSPSHCATAPSGRASSLLRLHDHTQTHHTPLDEWSSRHKDLYLQHTTVTRERHPSPGGIRTRYPRKRAAADPRLRPRGHWNWTIMSYQPLNVEMCKHTPIQRIKCGDPHDWWGDNSSDGTLVRILTKFGLGGTKAIIKHTRILQLQTQNYQCSYFKHSFFSFSSTTSYPFLLHKSSCVQLSYKICFSIKIM